MCSTQALIAGQPAAPSRLQHEETLPHSPARLKWAALERSRGCMQDPWRRQGNSPVP